MTARAIPRRRRSAWATVRCPGCGRYYRALVHRGWARRLARRTWGYPELECLDCVRAEGLARRTGLTAAECRSPERSAL